MKESGNDVSVWRSVRRFYRRHRTAVTAAAIFAVSAGLIGRVPLMPDADAMYTPLSGLSSFVLSPAAGGALLYRQRSRKAMWWYALAIAAGTTAPMLYGYFHNLDGGGGSIGGTLRSVFGTVSGAAANLWATVASCAPALLFIGGALVGLCLARRYGRRRRW